MADSSNYFIDLAERQMSAPVKRKIKKQEDRAAEIAAGAQTYVPTPAERKIREESKLLRQWVKWHRERRRELFSGDHKIEFMQLIRFLRTMTTSDAAKLIEIVKRSGWLLTSPLEARQEMLSTINQAIVRVRERAGLVPIDDALPGEPLTAFLQIREMLR